MILLEVGKTFPNFSKYSVSNRDALVYQYDKSGHHLTLFLHNLRKKEIRGFRYGEIQLALTPVQPAIYFLFKITDVFEWSDAPYSSHLVKPVDYQIPNVDQFSTLFHMHLVNADTGTLEAMRCISLESEFTQQLHRSILEQSNLPFESSRYHAHCKEIEKRYMSSQLFDQSIVQMRVPGKSWF